MSESFWSISSPLGLISVTGGAPEVVLAAAAFQPSLPPGMSVVACHAVIVRLSQLRLGCAVSVDVRLEESSRVTGGAETGEGLEALVWRGLGHVLAVGTEDDELFCLRTGAPAPALRFQYHSHELTITCQQPEHCQEIVLHLVLAWNPEPEQSPESCWYAVDQKHESIASRVAA